MRSMKDGIKVRRCETLVFIELQKREITQISKKTCVIKERETFRKMNNQQEAKKCTF